MDDLTIRPYSTSDAVSVTGLMNAMEIAAGGDAIFTEGEIRSLLAAEIREPAHDTRLVLTPDGALAAAGTVAAPPPAGARAHADGGVHPRWRGRGIGRALLGWQLERAAEIQA